MTDTGTATYTVNATGKDLQYNWDFEDSSIEEYLAPYITGFLDSTLVINIDKKLDREISGYLFCTVFDSYGRSVESQRVHFTYTLSPEAEPEIVLGDVNGDSKINAADSNYIRRVLTGQYPLNENILKAADLNGDGSVNSIDINYLAKLILGQ